MRKLLLLLLLLCPITVMAQGGGQQGGYPAYRFRRLAADPATCTTGDVYFNYVTPAYRKCQTTNTWTDFAFSGGAFTSPALGPDGTAALPTYSFSSDPDTGMFRSGANAIGFSTGGTERWVVNASGALNPFIDNAYDIGNGTVNPRDVNVSRKLVLGKAATNTGQIDFAGTTSGVVSVKPADAAGTWTMTLPANDGDSGQYLQTNGSGVTSWQTVTAGIGGSTGATDNAILRADGVGGATLQNSSPTINDNGAITVPNGTAAAPSYTFVGDSGGTGFSRPFANQIEVSVSTSRTHTFYGDGFFQGYGANAGYGFGATAGSLDTGLSRVAAGVVEVNNGTAGTIRDIVFRNFKGSGTGAAQLSTAQTTAPTCSSNCGTSPSVVGTDTFMRVTMGASGSPASGWVVTFNGTWAAAPVCTVQMAKAGMAVGKQPLTVVTTTTTLTVVTNGTAPATTDVYAITCGGVQ